MRKSKLVLLLFTSICFARDLAGQSPLEWQVTAQKKAGDQYTITAAIKLAAGFHVYALQDTALGLEPIRFSFDNLAVQAGGNAVADCKATVINDPVFNNQRVKVFTGNFTVEEDIIIRGNIPSKLPVTLNCFFANSVRFEPFGEQKVVVLEGGKYVDISKIPGIDLAHPINSCGEEQEQTGLWFVFFKGFGAGLLAILMPCLFPMIPLTVSFFTGRANGVRNSILYGLSIVFIYTISSLPFHLMSGLDPQLLNNISTNVTLNIILFLVFIALGLSLFGVFELRLPSFFGNKTAVKSDNGTLTGIFFMALTLTIISFSCTGPILGFLLAGSAGQGAWPLTVGMMGFGIALSLPFSLFALFPHWLERLPKSGQWMDTLKKSFGFIELAFALKFLSNADLVKHWGILKRETFIATWLGITLVWAIWLLAKARGSWVMGTLAGILIAFSFYLGIGLMSGSNLSLLSGFPPPLSYSIRQTEQDLSPVINDYDKALQMAKAQNKPLLIDFTGWACVNCRKMEENVWTKPGVRALISSKFILLSLYVDDRKKLHDPIFNNGRLLLTVGDKWAAFQSANFNQVTQPMYVLLSPDEKLLNNPVGYTPDAIKYSDWLNCGMTAMKNK